METRPISVLLHFKDARAELTLISFPSPVYPQLARHHAHHNARCNSDGL